MGILKSKAPITLLISIIALAFFLRFYQLTSIPSGLDWDEVSSVYNGYSIAQTGMDEYGQSYPFLFRAFNAYIPPVIIYLDALSSTLFGLNGFAARFPTAFLGTASIVGLYLLTSILTQNKKWALFGALFLALSPWHITYSRVGTLASLPLVFIIFGTYFYIRGLKQKGLLPLSMTCFVIATLTYFAAYIFVPLYVFALTIIYRKKMVKIQSVALIVVVICAALLPFILPGGQTRFRGVSAISDPDLIKKDATFAISEWGGKLIHNRRLVYAQILLEGYFSNFQYSFLFNKADAVTRFSVPGPGFGLLYWAELPLLLLGAYLLLRYKPRGWQLILIWLLLAPVPTAPTMPRPASTRAILMVPVLSIIVAYGFWYLTSKSSKLVQKCVILLFSLNIVLFTHQYFIHFPQEKSDEWFAQYQPLFSYLNQYENINKKVIFYINQPDYLDEVHMFTAFYGQIDPKMYQLQGGTRISKYGTTGEFTIGRFVFIPRECIDCGKETTFNASDLVVVARKLPSKPIITFPQNKNQSPVLYVYQMRDIHFQELINKK